jgi:hypothetical protein
MSRLDFYHKPVKVARRKLTVNGFGGEPLPNSPHLKAVSAAIWKAVAIAPVAVKSPQNEIPPSLKSPATRPVVTGHRGEVSTPTSFDPAQAPEDKRHCHCFPNR